ncbi:MAG: hypothetical protein RLZ98_2645 [Pseudomonadota bacterium]|jgi:hypothetical protein
MIQSGASVPAVAKSDLERVFGLQRDHQWMVKSSTA